MSEGPAPLHGSWSGRLAPEPSTEPTRGRPRVWKDSLMLSLASENEV